MSYDPTRGRYEKKITDQQKTIAALKAELSLAERGTSELRLALDGVLIQLALIYGERDESGEITLSLPEIPVRENTEGYSVTASPDPKKGYLVRVKKK